MLAKSAAGLARSYTLSFSKNSGSVLWNLGLFCMHKRTLVTSSIYSISQAIGGLLLHPYQTMQHLVEEKVFFWLSFVPVPSALLFFGIWWGLLQLFFLQIPYIGLWAFLLIWGGFFFLFWQILLLYLFVRFLITLR